MILFRGNWMVNSAQFAVVGEKSQLHQHPCRAALERRREYRRCDRAPTSRNASSGYPITCLDLPDRRFVPALGGFDGCRLFNLCWVGNRIRSQ